MKKYAVLLSGFLCLNLHAAEKEKSSYVCTYEINHAQPHTVMQYRVSHIAVRKSLDAKGPVVAQEPQIDWGLGDVDKAESLKIDRGIKTLALFVSQLRLVIDKDGKEHFCLVNPKNANQITHVVQAKIAPIDHLKMDVKKQ